MGWKLKPFKLPNNLPEFMIPGTDFEHTPQRIEGGPVTELPPQPSQATLLEAAGAAFGIEQRTLASRRRRRSSLLANMGAGDDLNLPNTLPSAKPGKTALGA